MWLHWLGFGVGSAGAAVDAALGFGLGTEAGKLWLVTGLGFEAENSLLVDEERLGQTEQRHSHTVERTWVLSAGKTFVLKLGGRLGQESCVEICMGYAGMGCHAIRNYKLDLVYFERVGRETFDDLAGLAAAGNIAAVERAVAAADVAV